MSDSDLEIKGGVGEGGGRSAKKIFSALRASLSSKISFPPSPSSGSATGRLKSYFCKSQSHVLNPISSCIYHGLNMYTRRTVTKFCFVLMVWRSVFQCFSGLKCAVPENIHTPPPPQRKGSDFPGGRGVNFPNFPVGKYFQRVLVTRKRVTKKKHRNLRRQFICKDIKHDES